MKKLNKFFVAFASLGMVIAGGAAIAVTAKAAVKTSAVEAVSKTWDFTAKTTPSASYTSAWTYGTDCSINGGANNSAGWDYIRVGGKATTASVAKESTMSTTASVSSAITKITLSAVNISSNAAFTMNSITLTVYSNSGLTTLLDTVSGVTVATSMTWAPTSGTAWAANSYYKFTYNWTSSSTSKNYGMDVNKIEYYSDVTFGTLASISIATAANTTSYEGGETFSSAGLVLTAKDTDNNTKTVSSGFTTNYDAHVFSDTDIGTKTVTISYTEGSVTVTTAYAITITETPKWQSVFGSGIGFTSEKGSTATPITGNIAAGEQQQTITKDNLFWTMDLKCSNSGIYFDAGYSTDLALGSSSFPCTTCTFTSGIPYISGALGITKVVVDASAGGTTSLSVAIEGTTIGTAQTLTSSQVAYSFAPASATFGHIKITFSQPSTTKWIDIFRVRIYGAVDTASNNGKAYGLAARIEQADACTYSAALDTLKTDYEADATVKGLVDAITVYDYASTAIKSATVSYRGGSVTCDAKMAKIASLITAQSGAAILLSENSESSSMIIVIITMAAVLIGGAYLYIRRRKHA
jgi:hypothetical protein